MVGRLQKARRHSQGLAELGMCDESANIVTLVHMEKLGYNPVFTLVSSILGRCGIQRC